ncbi:PMS1 protein homolog 1-like [Lingula anatina]|uniref:PMS1 protein homolog 1-like n=1 Tax=Lingula anatina TaxID=7574 RepID=A0A2R2ML27_LINAN|nr:PMS1 protein homolog 1-like [Lingula anatina]|eukprot:XP_023930926.1 PMS1 protein homolog 1-like [Lingula anatina]
MESRLKQLPASTVRLIGSGQVITSVYSVVKELVENALDAKATAVEIKLEKFGLEKIEVRDNGRGVQKSDVPHMGQRHFTSKITGQQDLDNLDMYGFRGEALASLCAVSEVAVTTKTIQDEVSTVYTLDHSGHVLSERASHLGQGTTILACNLFKNLPVRKQYYNSVNKKKEELKKVEDLIISFGIIRPDVRIALRHNKDVVWQKNVVTDHRTVLLQCLGTTVMKSMEHIVWHQDAENQMDIEAYLPKSDSSLHVTSRATSDRFFLYVNKRPVVLKDVEKLVRKYYTAGSGCEGSRCPIAFLSLTVPPSQLDVNVDPNKTKVLLHQKDDVCELLKKLLEQTYGPLSSKESSQGAGSEAQGTGPKMVDTESSKETNPEFTISTDKDNFTLNNGQKEDPCTTDHENGNCVSNGKRRPMMHDEEQYQIEFLSGADDLGKDKEKSSVDPVVNLNSLPEFYNNCESEDILSTQKPNFNLIGEEFSDLIPQTQMATNQNDLEEVSNTSTNQTSTILRDSFSMRKDNIGPESSMSEHNTVKSTNQNNGLSEELAYGRTDDIVSNTTSLNTVSAEENANQQSDSGSEDDWNDDSFFDNLLKNNKNSDTTDSQASEKAFDFKTPSPTLGSAERSKVNLESDSENRQDKVNNFSSKKCPESIDVDQNSGQSLINMEDWSKGRGLEGGILQVLEEASH